MITPRSTDSDFGESSDQESSPSSSLIADIQFWIDHPSLDDLTSAQSESDRQQVRRDVEECIRLLTIPTNRVEFNDGNVELDSSPKHLPSPRYVVFKLLGVGAFGVVLQAKDRILNRDVAIKMLRPSVLISKRARSRFAVEGEALARCNCEGIVPIYEVGQVEGNPYLVMGLIQGMTLAEFVKKQQHPVSANLAARIVAAIADAIHRAHQRGILHRDLKPSNVLLEQNNDPRLGLPFHLFVSDFGLAKDLFPGSCSNHSENSTDSPIIGTVRYMSPEQATGQNSDVSVKSDVFSLGVILYELLTLQCPFTGATTYEVIRQVANSQPISLRQVNSNIPRELEAIVGRALAKLPSDRYQSAGELSDDLHRYLERKPVVAKPAGPVKATLFWVKRNPTLASTSAIIWLGLIVSTIAISLLYRENLKSLQVARDATVREDQSRKFTLKAIDSSFRYTAEEILHNVPQSNSLKLQLHQKALEINTELAEQRGYDEESMNRLNIAHHLVANDAENCQQFELSSIHRSHCLEILRDLASKYPKTAKYQFYLFSNRFLRAQGSMSNDDYLAWLMQTREHLHSAISLAPNNPDYEDADAAICYKLAYFDSKKSEEWLQLAIRKSFELGSKHPDRPHYFKHAIFGHNAIAQNAVKAGQWAEACEHCERAMKLIDNHFRTSQNNADIHSAILATLEFHARALEHLDIPKAIAVYEQFITAAEKFEKLEKKYEFYRMLRADAHLSQAKLHHQLGDSATCQQFFAEALTVLEGYVPYIDSHAGMLADLQSRIAEFGAMLHGTH